MVGCLIAGSRCTYKNGVSYATHSMSMISNVRSQATAVIPSSHLWGTDRAPKVDEVTYAEMEPGSALFTLGCEYDTAELGQSITKHILLQQHTTVPEKTNAKRTTQTLCGPYSQSSGKYTARLQ